MNTDTGICRELFEAKELKPKEVLVNRPQSDCARCEGRGSIPRADAIRAERRRAEKAGLPIWAKFLPCPQCNS